jgi:CRISPR-associated protein Cas8a1/Csx13
MSRYTLSLLDPNTLLPHRAGIAGLAMALSEINPKNAPPSWEVTEDTVILTWTCTDQEAVQWLLNQTYQIQDGYLDVPALKLDRQARYTFTEGVTATLLQHSKQRIRDKETKSLSFTIEDGQPEIKLDFRPVLDCYYTRDVTDAFNTKGAFKPEISLKGHHLPGLVECFVNGAYQESPTGFLSLLFLPLACGYYKLPNLRSALVLPEVTNLLEWVAQRREASGRVFQRLKSPYTDFRASGTGESALRFLLREKVTADAKPMQVEYCEVYQLGSQPWDGNQSYLKQSVYRVEVNHEILELYDIAEQLFSAKVRVTDKGESWLAMSRVLPWISENLVTGKPWYSGFYEFRKQNSIYERKGLVTMTDYLTETEQTLFDAVQGAFSAYLRGQILQAQKQGRPLDYGQVTDKVIYRLQRPSTQQEFATALVDFLSQFRSKAARSAGAQIYAWIHREASWRQARDLVLLAIATYTSKKGDALDGAEIPIESNPDAESVDSEVFEMSL